MSARSLVVALAVCMVLPPAAAADAPSWQPVQPTPPGGQFPASVGPTGDMQFYAPNRGLLITSGSGSEAFSSGLLYWNGQKWRQLATVCGGGASQARIAWAGPNEFWTISAKAKNSVLITVNGSTLCHFRDGAVIASYAVLDSAADPYQPLEAATCNGPDDCWFGGIGAQTPDASRRGSFHLHWDGNSLSTQYLSHGRAASDLEAHDGSVFESTFVGGLPRGSFTDTVPHNPEPVPHLLQRMSGSAAASDPWLPAASSAPANGGTQLDGLDSDGSQLWAVGNSARSGPDFDSSDPFERPPLAVRFGLDDAFHQINFAGSPFSSADRFVDVAAMPESDGAWVAIQTGDSPNDPDAYAKVALLHSDGTVTDQQTLPADGPPRGPAAKVACSAIDDCWMVTSLGWIFHYSDGSQGPIDDSPAFSGVIDSRPPDGLTPQGQPDTIPEDDSLLFQQPPPVDETPPPVQQAKIKRLRAAVRKVRTKLRGRRKLAVSFTLTRRVRVSLVAKRRGRVIARTKLKRMPRGRHTVLLPLDPKRPPTGLSFITREIGSQNDTPAPQDPDSVTTGGDPDAIATGHRGRRR